MTIKVDLDVLKQLIEEGLRLATRYLATVETHLKALRKMNKYGIMIPHELSSRQLQLRVDVCIELMTSHRNYRWLHNLITGDEKLVLYLNYTDKRQWLGAGQTGVATPKNELHPMKIMRIVW